MMKTKITELGHDHHPLVMVLKTKNKRIKMECSAFERNRYFQLSPGQARRLAAWLLKAADYKEPKKKKRGWRF